MRKRGTLLWLAAILAITIIAYLPAFNCGFTNWNDPGYVSENPYIRNLDIESLKVILEKIPFLIIALTFGIIAIKSQDSSFYFDTEYSYTFPQRCLFACYGLAQYTFKLIIPINLSAVYPYPVEITYDY